MAIPISKEEIRFGAKLPRAISDDIPKLSLGFMARDPRFEAIC
ncbi:MAG TPA: hypothetical protein VGM62_12755 [Chthoniobacterales bacterium]|jgi:hypothetical protein